MAMARSPRVAQSLPAGVTLFRKRMSSAHRCIQAKKGSAKWNWGLRQTFIVIALKYGERVARMLYLGAESARQPDLASEITEAACASQARCHGR